MAEPSVQNLNSREQGSCLVVAVVHDGTSVEAFVYG